MGHEETDEEVPKEDEEQTRECLPTEKYQRRQGKPTKRRGNKDRRGTPEDEHHMEEYLNEIYRTIQEEEGTTLAACFDDEEDEVYAAEDYGYVMVEGILDSGSVTHVMDPEDAPGYEVRESPGSRRGQKFTGAGGEKIANDGQMDLALVAENEHTKKEHEIRCNVQAAKVTRPLFSVGRITENGIDVLFRKGYAVTIDAKTGKDITRHPRENGIYKFKAKLKAPSSKSPPRVFQRQG